MENENYITYKKPNVQTGQTDLELLNFPTNTNITRNFHDETQNFLTCHHDLSLNDRYSGQTSSSFIAPRMYYYC